MPTNPATGASRGVSILMATPSDQRSVRGGAPPAHCRMPGRDRATGSAPFGGRSGHTPLRAAWCAGVQFCATYGRHACPVSETRLLASLKRGPRRAPPERRVNREFVPISHVLLPVANRQCVR